MSDRIVFFTGAGFSSPARLPIQNQILREMTQNPVGSFLDEDETAERESEKFLLAYIQTGIYLLQAYTTEDISKIESTMTGISKAPYARQILQELIEKLPLMLSPTASDQAESERKTIIDVIGTQILSKEQYYADLVLLKETIRHTLEEKNLDISLEDVFTSFDKSMQQKENRRQYTYSRLDSIRHSLLRLFSYYFGKHEFAFNFQTDTYASILAYLNANRGKTSIISTNWDTLMEQSLRHQGLSYDLCLNESYYKYDDSKKKTQIRVRDINLVKVHGSINWFRCMNCGMMHIVEKTPYTDYLLDDSRIEACSACGDTSHEHSILLQPEIITPSMVKYIESQVFRNLWKAATQFISEADKLIFLGYSLPLADFELRYMLQRCVPESTVIDVVLYRNDDPAQLDVSQNHIKEFFPEKRYRSLFSKNEIRFFYDGFQEYFEQQVSQ